MLFPEISIRSSTASNPILLPDRSSGIYLSGSKQNFQRHLLISSNSNSELQKNFYSNCSGSKNFKNASSLHEKGIALAKKTLIKRNERNFPKDFFENVLKSSTSHHKTESNYLEQIPSIYPRNNSCLVKARVSESLTIPKEEPGCRKKTLPDNYTSISSRYHKFSNVERSDDYTYLFGENTLKKMKEKQDGLLIKEKPHIAEVLLEDSMVLIEKNKIKRPFNNPKFVSKSHPLKPIFPEKSQSTQENSKILTDTENEFLEIPEKEQNLTEPTHSSKEQKQNWGALFTFYEKNMHTSKKDLPASNKNNSNSKLSKEKAEEEDDLGKTGNFKIQGI